MIERRQVHDNAGGGESEGALMNWQKAEILSHPLYEQLLAAHVACLRIATPVDQLPRIDAQLGQSQQVFSKYKSGHVANNLDDDVTHHKELHQFMVIPLFITFNQNHTYLSPYTHFTTSRATKLQNGLLFWSFYPFE